MRSSHWFVVILSGLLFSTIPVLAESPASEMAAAAGNFLAAMTPEQKAIAVYEFKGDQRFDWHFVPKPRKGLTFKDMTPPQRLLAHALLNSALSQKGYAKVATIMSLEQILYEIENQAPRRNAEVYYVTVFGEPSKSPWGWRVEGHHLSLNFVVQGDAVTSTTPLFFGSNPGQIQSGPRKGLRVLGGEEDLGRELAKSLIAEQRGKGIITNVAPRDIITGNSRKAQVLEPKGIAASDLSKTQQEMLVRIVKEYLFRCRSEIAEADLQKIQSAGWGKLFFAWAGGLEPGQGHYYRVQGPSFLLEYDNTQDRANHVHTVWRDLLNDFGDDALQKHYQQAHGQK